MVKFLYACLHIAGGDQQTGQPGLARVMETSSRIAITEAKLGVSDASLLTHCSINLKNACLSIK